MFLFNTLYMSYPNQYVNPVTKFRWLFSTDLVGYFQLSAAFVKNRIFVLNLHFFSWRQLRDTKKSLTFGIRCHLQDDWRLGKSTLISNLASDVAETVI